MRGKIQFGGIGYDYFESIRQTADGGYILGGYSDSGISGDKTETSQGDYDYWAVKLDNTGQTIEWQYTIGGSESDYLFSTLQTIDGGYILGGYSRSGISGAKTEESQGSFDYWVVKLAPDNPLAVENYAGTSIVEKFRVLPVYPNPFNPSTTITYGIPSVETYGDASVHISIYDITGKFIITLLNSEQTPGWHTVIWNGTNQQGELVPNGLYLSVIISGYEVKTTKLMLLR